MRRPRKARSSPASRHASTRAVMRGTITASPTSPHEDCGWDGLARDADQVAAALEAPRVEANLRPGSAGSHDAVLVYARPADEAPAQLPGGRGAELHGAGHARRAPLHDAGEGGVAPGAALGAGCARRSLRSAWALRPGRSGAAWALRSYGSLRAGRALHAGWSGRPGRT